MTMTNHIVSERYLIVNWTKGTWFLESIVKCTSLPSCRKICNSTAGCSAPSSSIIPYRSEYSLEENARQEPARDRGPPTGFTSPCRSLEQFWLLPSNQTPRIPSLIAVTSWKRFANHAPPTMLFPLLSWWRLFHNFRHSNCLMKIWYLLDTLYIYYII